MARLIDRISRSISRESTKSTSSSRNTSSKSSDSKSSSNSKKTTVTPEVTYKPSSAAKKIQEPAKLSTTTQTQKSQSTSSSKSAPSSIAKEFNTLANSIKSTAKAVAKEVSKATVTVSNQVQQSVKKVISHDRESEKTTNKNLTSTSISKNVILSPSKMASDVKQVTGNLPKTSTFAFTATKVAYSAAQGAGGGSLENNKKNDLKPTKRQDVKEVIFQTVTNNKITYIPKDFKQEKSQQSVKDQKINSFLNDIKKYEENLETKATKTVSNIKQVVKNINPEKTLDRTQVVLDLIGLVPGYGEPADLTNAGIYLIRNDKTNAMLSAGAAAPFIGSLGTSTKLGLKAVDAIKDANIVKKIIEAGDETVSAGKLVDKGLKNNVIKGGSDALQALSRQSVDDKLTRYLLNADHSVGGSKAKWFKEALGYTQSNMDDLAKQIVFDPTKAVQTGVTEYGTKFNQAISITGANGKVIDVTFVWMKSAEDDVVRLVTSIPTKK